MLTYVSSQTITRPATTRPKLFSGTPFNKNNQDLSSATAADTTTPTTSATTPVAELLEVYESDIVEPHAKPPNDDPPPAATPAFQDINMPELLHALRRSEATMRIMGENQSANFVDRHLRKVEKLYRSAPADQRNSMFSLLKYEKEELRVHHGPAPSSSSADENNGNQRLNDSSAAMGLLWINRVLAFNCQWYSLMVPAEPDKKHEPRDAARVAYQSVVERYHGWVMRGFATMAMRTFIPPQRATVLARLGGFETRKNGNAKELQLQEEVTIRDMRRLVAAWKPLVANWQRTFQMLGLDDTSRI